MELWLMLEVGRCSWEKLGFVHGKSNVQEYRARRGQLELNNVHISGRFGA